MTSEEQTQAVEELETRVERIRALYEQYFMGIEKIEPLVQRKDIDRRLWMLRREQIRNTGLRFKLQQVISRYNTFGQYWMRIIREIENGTYKRDVARAAKRFGTEALTIAAKRRLGKRGVEAAEKEKAARSVAPPPSEENENESTSPFSRRDLPLSERSVDQTIPDAEPMSVPVPSVPPARVPSKPKQAPIHLDLDLDDDDDDLFAGLDMKRSAPPARPLSSPMIARPASDPRIPAPSREPPPRAPSIPPPRPSAPVTRAPSGAQSAPPAPRPSAPQPASSPGMRSGLAGSSPLRGSSLASSGNPFGERPKPRQASVPPPPPPPPARPAASRDAGDLSDGRVRELYAKYVDAKRQCNEPTEKITSDSLAKSLRESATKLRQKHAGKQVDFDVVIKDGKAVLKPVLKG